MTMTVWRVLSILLLGFNGFYGIGTLWRLYRFEQSDEDRRMDLFILAYLALQGLVVGHLL